MDYVSGVLWGALIALVASVTGGVLTALVGPALARQADRRARAEAAAVEAAATREKVLRESIHDIAEGLRKWVEAWGHQHWGDKAEARESVRAATLQLRLWTTIGERIVGASVTEVLTAPDAIEATARFGAWDTAAVDWFRGGIRVEEFQSMYQQALEAQFDWIEEERQRHSRR